MEYLEELVQTKERTLGMTVSVRLSVKIFMETIGRCSNAEVSEALYQELRFQSIYGYVTSF